MLICPVEACNDAPGEGLVPISAHVIKCTAKFLCLSLRRSDALTEVARHLHQRSAAFSTEKKLITDYQTILDAVHQHDPLLS
ncbi:hypothetical protein [Citrobacter werkmanii]|uniref:hypothetical protein n=1 Tax=Citrobacter werkmanii TaxID=67827 RepID=UPI0037C9C2BD